MDRNLEKKLYQHLLTNNGLSLEILQKVLASAHAPGADFTDIYLESSYFESWSLEDGLVKNGSFDLGQGAGIRVNTGEQTGLAYCDVLTEPGLFLAAHHAKQIIQIPTLKSPSKISHPHAKSRYPAIDPRLSLTSQDQVNLLKAVDQYARSKDPRITQVLATLASSQTQILILASDDTLAVDNRPLVRLSVTVILESNGQREQGFAGGGGRHALAQLLEPNTWQTLVNQAIHGADVNLQARSAPAGVMDVVLGSGWPGVLIHEAVGHGLEADFNRKMSSAFSHKMGQVIASPLCSIVDDGTLANLRGSLTLDDEGTPTHCTSLIEKGVLVGYLHDKLSARLMGQAPTGNGRRESYAHKVLPRMTNTYLQPGEHTPEEIIASIDKGLYAVNFNGGQVDITSGKFVFATSEAYFVERGKIQYPVKGATLIGDGPSALMRVSMVGNDLRLDPGIGVCGKEGQSLPVGVGQPTIRINQMVVGGV